MENTNQTCNFCGKPVENNYCSNCGEPVQLRRVDGKYIADEIGRVINFDRGFLFSIRELLIRPGKSVRAFLTQERKRLVKPVVFVILCSLIYTLLQRIFHFEDGYVNFGFEEGTTVHALFTWIAQNYGYANLMMAIFIAVWVKLFFWRKPYNIFETLILICFLMGNGMLIFGINGVLQTVTGIAFYDIGVWLGILYIGWGIGMFFQGKIVWSVAKGFISYFLGMISFFMLVLFLGLGIDRFF